MKLYHTIPEHVVIQKIPPAITNPFLKYVMNVYNHNDIPIHITKEDTNLIMKLGINDELILNPYSDSVAWMCADGFVMYHSPSDMTRFRDIFNDFFIKQ